MADQALLELEDFIGNPLVARVIRRPGCDRCERLRIGIDATPQVQDTIEPRDRSVPVS
jgi:hypothetical protein